MNRLTSELRFKWLKRSERPKNGTDHMHKKGESHSAFTCFSFPGSLSLFLFLSFLRHSHPPLVVCNFLIISVYQCSTTSNKCLLGGSKFLFWLLFTLTGVQRDSAVLCLSSQWIMVPLSSLHPPITSWISAASGSLPRADDSLLKDIYFGLRSVSGC